MRKFVMGDIHGAHRAMLQCFERSGFDDQNDLLIQLGDVADGYPEIHECVEELLQVKNRICLKVITMIGYSSSSARIISLTPGITAVKARLSPTLVMQVNPANTSQKVTGLRPGLWVWIFRQHTGLF
jgi:hypothetical protein